MIVVATSTIEERQALSLNNVMLVEVEKNVLFEDALASLEDIESCYVNLDYTIASGSVISSSMISDQKPLILESTHVAYSYILDSLKAVGMSIEKGQLVEIYGVYYPPYEESIVDLLIEDVEILAVLDRNGKEVEADAIAYMVQLSIPEKWIILLSTLQKEGGIELYSNGEFANKKSEPSLYEDSRILTYLSSSIYQ